MTAARLLALAGAGLWVLAVAVIAQRQRVLHRRLVRIERRLGLRQLPPAPPRARPREPHGPLRGQQRVYPFVLPPTSDRVPAPPPAPPRRSVTVQQLAALARPLQRAGG